MRRVIGTVVACMAVCLPIAAQLRFGADGTLKIVQFTDIHWVPGAEESSAAADCMRKVLDWEKPDVVIYTGDIATGRPAAEAMDSALAPVIERGVPFAVTFGNHDDEHDLSRRELYDYVAGMEENLTATVEGLTGVTNFTLTVKASGSDSIAAVLYVMDTNAYASIEGMGEYDWVHRDQVEWYCEESGRYRELNGGTAVPALCFLHIPLPEYNEAASNEKVRMEGARFEKACAPELNTGLFAAMVTEGDVMGVFAGHDHVNNYAAYYKGVLLAYGQFTGGKTTYAPAENGARVIELREGARSFRTWIRMSNGDVRYDVTYPDSFVGK